MTLQGKMAKKKKQGGDACSAIACSNARYKFECADMSFFRFPKDEERYVMVCFCFLANEMFVFQSLFISHSRAVLALLLTCLT